MKKILVGVLLLISAVVCGQESWRDEYESKFSVNVPEYNLNLQMNEQKESLLNRISLEYFVETEVIVNNYYPWDMLEADGNYIGFSPSTGLVARIFISTKTWYLGNEICVGMSLEEIIQHMGDYPGELYTDKFYYADGVNYYIPYMYYVPELVQLFTIQFAFNSYDELIQITFYTEQ